MDEVDGIPLPSPVLARADALRPRRRPTGAGEADDLPVLTEIVDDGIPVLAETLPPPAPGPAFDADQLNLLAEELAHRLRSRLAAELPSLVEAALNAAVAGLTADLRQGIDETTRAAIDDFVAERQRIARLQGR